MGALTVDQVDELFAKIKEGEPDMYVTQPQGQTTSVLDSFFKQHDSMGDDMGVLLDHGQGSLKLVNLFETPYYEDAVRKAREWNEKGIHPAGRLHEPGHRRILLQNRKGSDNLVAHSSRRPHG